MAGSRQVIREVMVRVLHQTSQLLDADGLKIAAKSVILCSKLQDAKFISAKLKAKGVEVIPVLQTAYLGIDMGAGRQARATARKRVAKAGATSSKIIRFARASKRHRPAARLEQCGAQPAGHYGHEVKLGHAASSSRRGRCLTT
eukprot:7689483-Pyramimonas_sp.AAC.1